MHARVPFALTALLAFTAVAPPADTPQPSPLTNAHSHNDYLQKRPLLDALDQGFCSVEADVFLKDGKLLVAHTPLGLDPERTLEKLYLDPLRERVKANGGAVYKDGPAFHLLVDVKTEAKPTCAAIMKALEEYKDILTATTDGKVEAKAVTVVFSGSSDREGVAAMKTRYAAIDGRPKDLDGDASAALVPWVSDSWGSQFKWDGKGEMPAAERTKMRELVAKAHKQGRLVRFWGGPDRESAWAEQAAAGVDLINTDKLADLRAFLTKTETKK